MIYTDFILRAMHICPDDHELCNSGSVIWWVYWMYFKNLIEVYLDNIVPVFQSWHSNVLNGD